MATSSIYNQLKISNAKEARQLVKALDAAVKEKPADIQYSKKVEVCSAEQVKRLFSL